MINPVSSRRSVGCCELFQEAVNTVVGRIKALALAVFHFFASFWNRPVIKPLLSSVTTENLFIHKVILQTNSNQKTYDSSYDPNKNHPPACTLHALTALKKIAGSFDVISMWIAQSQKDDLSDFQRTIINEGLWNYQNNVPDATQGGIDLVNIPEMRQNMNLGEPQEGSFQDDLNIVVEHLSSGEDLKTAFITNSNNESFSMVAKAGRTIIFDSHYDEIIATGGKGALLEVLKAKNPLQGDGFATFTYALSV